MPNFYAAPTWSKYSVLICSTGLLAIWTLPGTIALRHLFLGVGFISSLFTLKEYSSHLRSKSAWPLWILVSLYGWLLIHLCVFSQEFSAQLIELRSVWARCLLGSFIGLALGLLLGSSSITPSNLESQYLAAKNPPADTWSRWSTLLLFFGFSAPCWITFASYLYAMIQSGQGTQFDTYSFLYGIYRTKSAYVVFEALTLPLCFILLLKAMQQKKPRRWIYLTLITIALSPFGGFFIGSKNAMVLFGTASILFMVSALLVATRYIVKFPRTAYGPIAALVLVGIIGGYGLSKHLERTHSWMAMADNVQVGMDIDHNDFWKNREAFPRPVNKQGQPVDISTYERTAWFTAGSRLLLENPQGYGLVHHSFGSLAFTKWPDFYKPNGNLRGATHSGWLDLALGIGIPGVVIIWICLITAFFRSTNRSGLWFTYALWTVPLLIFTYLIAEVGEGHFLELLLFMTAFFCGLTALPQYPNITHVQKS